MVVERYDPDLARVCKYLAAIDSSIPFLPLLVHQGAHWRIPIHEEEIRVVVELESAVRRVPLEHDAPFAVWLRRAHAWAGGALAGLLEPAGSGAIRGALESWSSITLGRIAGEESLREAHARLVEIGWRRRAP